MHEYTVTWGGCKRAWASAACTRGSAPSMDALWKAWETFRRVTPMSRASSVVANAAMSACGPAITVSCGAFSAAMSTVAGSKAVRVSASVRTASMAPPG